MTFLSFAKHLSIIESVSSRLEMTELLAQLYSSLDDLEIIPASYLMQGRLVPQYLSLEFQLSTKMLIRVLSQFAQIESMDVGQSDLFGETKQFSPVEEMNKRFKELGDIGILAVEVMNKRKVQQIESPSVTEVFNQLKVVAEESGTGSQDRKISALKKLLKQVSSVEAKYITRIVLGKMRLGFSVMTQIDALSWAATKSKDESQLIELAYQKKADIGLLAREYLRVVHETNSAEDRQKVLDSYQVEVGIPVVPALCQRLNTSVEIIDKLKEVIAEPKYDGLRVQIHIKCVNNNWSVSVFTRSLENITHMFPESKTIPEYVKYRECILDGEAIGYDRQSGTLLPFQKTITRKRKHNIDSVSEDVPIRFYIFDLLYLDKHSLINKKMLERKGVLHNLFKDNEVIMKAPYIITSDPNELHEFHEDALKNGLEGAVMKQADSYYVSGRKGWNWVKIKESEGSKGKLSDTLDLILMGYYFGRGKRAQFGLGAVLVGVLNEGGSVTTLAKIGTGMTEVQLVEIKALADSYRSIEKPSTYVVKKELNPDVWVTPDVVLEIAADELTTSPSHSSGVALRFPRLVKIRQDKHWEQATTRKELEQF